MTITKKWRLTVITMASLLFAVFSPPTPALALPEVSASPESGPVGTTVTVTGTGFESFKGSQVRVLFDDTEVASSPVMVLQDGTFTADFDVPTGTAPGTVTIKVYTVLGLEMQQSFEVTETKIEVSPTEGELSTMVTVAGNGFPPGSPITLYYSLKTGKAIVGEITTSSAGDFTYTFATPASTTGEHQIIAEDEQGNTAQATFEVSPAKIQVSPVEGTVSTSIKVNGSNFYGGEDVTLYYSDETGKASVGEETASSTGDFAYTFAIPESAAGDHKITAQDEQGNTAQASFKVKPVINVSPASGSIGDNLTVSGTGFSAASNVTIQFGGIVVTKDATSKSGSFQSSFKLVPFASGSYQLRADDENGNEAQAEFTVVAAATLSPTTGPVGTEVLVSGVGFKAGSPITVRYDNDVVATQDTDASGTLSAHFTVPPSHGGAHQVTITDGPNTVNATFTMETQSPPAPQPTLPTNESKAAEPVSFGWESVTDPSGVIYTLQVATSEDFAAPSIVLQKEGLTTSDYTLTKDEKLPSRSKDAPYYWRVRAIDGASNEGDWSTVWSFYVGSVFRPSATATRVLIGFGIAAVGLVCFGLGRKYALRV